MRNRKPPSREVGGFCVSTDFARSVYVVHCSRFHAPNGKGPLGALLINMPPAAALSLTRAMSSCRGPHQTDREEPYRWPLHGRCLPVRPSIPRRDPFDHLPVLPDGAATGGSGYHIQ